MFRYITDGGYREKKPYVSPEYQEQLDNLAEKILAPVSEDQLALEFEIQEAVIDGRMTMEEATQCLDDYIEAFRVDL